MVNHSLSDYQSKKFDFKEMDTYKYMCIYTECTHNYTNSYKFMKICDMNILTIISI